jgi:radical SAM protein with 4Fe4S-binding SPASM domain
MRGLIETAKSLVAKFRKRRRGIDDQPFDLGLINRIFVEPCFNYCKLRCPYCPVGQGVKLRDMPRGMMSLEMFRRIWAKSLTCFTGQVALYNWGEPFLNPELPKIVRHVRENSSATLVLNSTFSLPIEDRLTETLAHLDRDTFILSCDGFSQATCEKYRVNVDFELVMHNVEVVVRCKKPQTQFLWQYLKFPWNHDEIAAAEAYCKTKQIGFYTGTGGIAPRYPMLPTPRTAKPEKYRCDFFRDSLSINYDGGVYPCCAYYGPPKFCLGNAAEETLEAIFARGKGRAMLDYLALRSPGDEGIFCKHCVEQDTEELASWK